MQTVPEALSYWAVCTPYAPALRAIDGHELSHGELGQRVAEVAKRLAARGIERANRVVLVLPPSADAAVVLLGTMAAAVAAPLNAASTAHELTRDMERLSCQLVVTDGMEAESAAAALGIATIGMHALSACRASCPNANTALPAVTPDDIAVILHTSGTTGFPKRVPRPHRTLIAGAQAAKACSGLAADDVLLLVAGFHTNAGVVNLLAALAHGGTCVVAPGFDPAQYPDWLAQHRPTWAVLTVSELNLILDAAEAAGRETVAGPDSRLRIVRPGSQPMTPGTLERAERSLRALVLEGYGMTEASYITGYGPDASDRRDGSCGPPQGVAVRIVDESGRDVAANTVGAVAIRGPTLFPGYLDDPEANAAVFLPDGWFRTGDTGSVDEDGYLFLRGRLNEQINRGGENIAPAEVDWVLLEHPAVAEAGAFAVPDARLGEDIVAAVVFKPGMSATARELRRWLLDRLSPSKAPRRMWFVERLPRTATGKVQRGELARRWLAEQT
jgi:acyl-CoA synthetase (AMP-forming)/AMP-acid ligase II